MLGASADRRVVSELRVQERLHVPTHASQISNIRFHSDVSRISRIHTHAANMHAAQRIQSRHLDERAKRLPTTVSYGSGGGSGGAPYAAPRRSVGDSGW